MSSPSNLSNSQGVLPEPVLKWAGGKRRLLEQYARYFKPAFNNYFEPFFGGGAVYFWLWSQGRLDGKNVQLSDINPELINFYQVLQKKPKTFFQQLQRHQAQHGEEYYYAVRKQQPQDLNPTARATRLLYLNRTCFNGLYRENSRGEFNVPMGRYAKPRVFHPEGLLAASQALAIAQLRCRAYLDVENYAQPGDLVYFDPPYQPLTITSSFTSYTQHNFGPSDQQELAQLYTRLARAGVRVLLSNSDAPLIRELYQEFRQVKIQAARSINSKASGRAKITELLIVS